MKKLILGRHIDCDIRIEDEWKVVSRKHAILTIDSDGACSLEDLGSANGTYINGRKLNPKSSRKLKDEDKVMLGGKVDFDWKNCRGKYAADFTRVVPAPEDISDLDSERPEKQPSVAVSFFERAIPIPGLIKSIMLFYNLHFSPITKILTLIEQPESESEAHPYSFLGLALMVYIGFASLSASSGLGESAVTENSSFLSYRSETAMLITLALFIFIYSWLNYSVFKRLIEYPKSFNKYMKMISLSQGMIFIYSGLIIFTSILVERKAIDENMDENVLGIIAIILFLMMFMLLSYWVIHIRVSRLFWEISWSKFIPNFFVVSVISVIISSISFLGISFILP